VRQVVALAGGLVVGAASLPLHDDLAVVAHCLSLAALIFFAGSNRHVTGLLVVGVGLVLNLAGLVLNNGVAVRPEALVDADIVEVRELADHDLDEPQHLETDADSFPWLGAMVPVPLAHEVVSFGDLIALVGLADAARELARRRSRLPVVDDEDEDDPMVEGYRPATTAANVDQDWGDAPSGAPESGSQYSEKREERTAEAMEFWRDAAVSPSPAHLAARHDK